MIVWLLKILAFVIGSLILLLVFIKQMSIGIGIRTTRNVFTDHIANVSISTWLLVTLLSIEVVIGLVLFTLRGNLFFR